MEKHLKKLTTEIIERGHILSYDKQNFEKLHKAFSLKYTQTKQGILIEIGGLDEGILPNHDVLTIYLEFPWSLEVSPDKLFTYEFPDSLLAETVQVLYEFYKNKLYQLNKEKRLKLGEAYLKTGIVGYYKKILEIAKGG